MRAHHTDQSHYYLSPISKTFEKLILNDIKDSLPNANHQHGFKANHSTITALHRITNTIAKGFNEPKPPSRTVLASLDLSKAFDTININKLINKIHTANI